MNRWEETFKEHKIFRSLDEIETILNQILRSGKEYGSGDLKEIRRLRKIIAKAKNILQTLDYELTSVSSLNELEVSLRNYGLFSYLEAYSGGDGLYLIQANDSLAEFLRTLSSVAALSEPKINLKSSRKAEFRADELLEGLSTRVRILNSKIGTVESAQLDATNNIITLSQHFEARSKDLEILSSTWQEQFTSSQHNRDSEFNSIMRTYHQVFGSTKSEVETKFRSLYDELKSSSEGNIEKNNNSYVLKLEELVTSSKEKHTSILELYDLVAGDSVAAQYSQQAIRELKDADFWRWATIAFVVVAVIWQGISYRYLNSVNAIDTLVWTKLIKAFSLTALLLFGAGYSARQSGNHRQNEKRLRWFAFEVKAIDPFIASLNQEQKQELKHKLSERLFGQSNVVHEKEKEADQIDISVFGSALKSIESLVKAFK